MERRCGHLQAVAAISRLRGLSAVDVIALDDDIVTTAKLWIFALRDRSDSPVIQADAHAEDNFVGSITLTDSITHEPARNGAADGGSSTAVTMANGVTEQPTRHSPDDGAERRRVTLLVDLLDVADRTALVTATRRTGIHHAILVVDTTRRLIARRQRKRGEGGGNEAGLTDDTVHG
jgi:hypothetical protein